MILSFVVTVDASFFYSLNLILVCYILSVFIISILVVNLVFLIMFSMSYLAINMLVMC